MDKTTIEYSSILNRLTKIYSQVSQARRVSAQSQMCQFWEDPTVEILVGSSELTTLESEFGIQFDDNAAMDLYNMTLHEAAQLIVGMISQQKVEDYDPMEVVEEMTADFAKLVLLDLWREDTSSRDRILSAIERVDFKRNKEELRCIRKTHKNDRRND